MEALVSALESSWKVPFSLLREKLTRLVCQNQTQSPGGAKGTAPMSPGVPLGGVSHLAVHCLPTDQLSHCHLVFFSQLSVSS